MHALRLIVVFPVIIAALALATNSSASPSNLIVHRKHFSTRGGSRGSTNLHYSANSTRRTRYKHAMTTRSVDLLDLLISDHNDIIGASNDFHQKAQIVRGQPADGVYQQEAAASLTAYHHSLVPLQGLLAKLAADKGLANYDKSAKYETLLKDVIDACKRTLGDVDDIIGDIPLLGPVLGPSLYEIKCLLDQLLDATENITDKTLNQFGTLLKPLITSATGTICRSSLPVVTGLCLPL